VSVHAVDPAHSRIVLVGTPYYRTEELGDIPQVAANLADLAAVFVDPLIGRFPVNACMVAPVGAGVEEIGDLLHEAAGQAEDLLLFYYAGHGLIGHGGGLYLCLRNTRFQAPEYSALRFETVRGTFLRSPAANRVVIIDSCYSGRAIGPTLGTDEQVALEQLEISGTYTLASAPRNRPSLVLPGEAHTAFTGRLLSLLRDGSEHGGELLSLGEIYRHLYARLRADGLPLPQARGTATADLLGLVRNLRPAPPRPAALSRNIPVRGNTIGRARAMAVPTGPVPPGIVADARRESSWQLRSEALLDEAERIATELAKSRKEKALVVAQLLAATDPDRAERIAAALTDYDKVRVLPQIAHALAATDPDRAERISDQAERIAIGVSASLRGEVLAHLVREFADADPDRAERAAAAINDNAQKVSALAQIMQALAATDPQRASRIADRAEHIAATLTDNHRSAFALAQIAHALAAIDPRRAATFADRAERAAAAINDNAQKVSALAQIMQALAATDPQRASRIADQAERAAGRAGRIGIGSRAPYRRESALVQVAQAVAATDPDRAARIAATLADGYNKALVLVQVAQAVAATDPDRAERIAATLIDERSRALALVQVAQAVAATDPDRAERIAATLIDERSRALALVQVAQAVAATDPDRAARIVAPLTDEHKALVVAQIAHALAATDPGRAATFADRAEHIAATLTDELQSASTLARIALVWLAAG
jgi:Caspase domain